MADSRDIVSPGAAPAPVAVARGSNQSGMRAHNERLVLTLLRTHGPLAKAPVARMTGLSAQTASVIMRKLELDGLVLRGEPQRGRVGQPQIPMHLDPRGAYCLGMKVGRRSLELVLPDFLGTVLGRRKRVHTYPGFDACRDFAVDAARALTADLDADARARIAGLGIATPFRLWEWARTLGVSPDAMADWRHRDIAVEIADRLDMPVFLQNDASSACGAELVFGRRDLPRSFLYVYVGYFVGGGLVLDGSLYVGRTGNAAALGSMPVPRPSGGADQLIDVASLATLEAPLAAAGGDPDTLWTETEGWQVPESVLAPWLATASRGIASALAAAASVVDVDAALIDGWLPADVRARLAAGVAQDLCTVNLAGIDPPEVLEGTLGPDARVLGAASLPLSHRFLVDRDALLVPA